MKPDLDILRRKRRTLVVDSGDILEIFARRDIDIYHVTHPYKDYNFSPHTSISHRINQQSRIRSCVVDHGELRIDTLRRRTRFGNATRMSIKFKVGFIVLLMFWSLMLTSFVWLISPVCLSRTRKTTWNDGRYWIGNSDRWTGLKLETRLCFLCCSRKKLRQML